MALQRYAAGAMRDVEAPLTTVPLQPSEGLDTPCPTPIRQHRMRKAAVVRVAVAAYLLWEGTSAGASVLGVVQDALGEPGHNSFPPVRHEADWMGDGCNFSRLILDSRVLCDQQLLLFELVHTA